MDKNLSGLLRWGIEHTDTSGNAPTTQTEPMSQAELEAKRAANADLMKALMSGPSDADLMKESIAAIKSPDVDLENKLIAFDNFEQLVESIDNANNITPLALWEPLLQELESEEAQLRAMAAWCIATAVQNNIKAQEKITELGSIPRLTYLSVKDQDEGVRKKAILALSAAVRNHEPALEQVLSSLPVAFKVAAPKDAGDMEAIDAIIQKLRDASKEKALAT